MTQGRVGSTLEQAMLGWVLSMEEDFIRKTENHHASRLDLMPF
jgi:hypothetical protein